MNERITAGAAVLLASITAGTRGVLRLWPAPTGRHRARRGLAGVVFQAFRHCPACGGPTAAVVHADGSHTCTEGHCTRPGGTQ